MTRSILDQAHIHPAIRETIANRHADYVQEVQAAIAANDVVVVGMKQNPMPRKARKALDAAGLSRTSTSSTATTSKAGGGATR